ncbi:MAG: UDP-N-acetylmuramate--L-alanine ligase [Spirochaetales bacterium]|nr:UDP-N-acetylmuramate--L-alanine ligase [Spirochaetales bacterium]
MKNLCVHMVGIKGTGMTALAEILKAKGASITGSDTHEKFYTDTVLAHLNIPVIEDFTPHNIHRNLDLIIYSSAYTSETHPELQKALQYSIPMLTYPEALGILSTQANSSGIAGVHGKTTTTAIAGTIMKEVQFPATIITGSQVPTFHDSSTLHLGDTYLIAETCEYKRHFLKFKADQIVLTNVELDHPDYFTSLEDIMAAFEEYVCALPEKGVFIYNADDRGAVAVLEKVKSARKDIVCIPYGKNAHGRFRVKNIELSPGEIRFSLEGFDKAFSLSVPGEHTILNSTAAIALCIILLEKEHGSVQEKDIRGIQEGLKNFRGSKRRSEILGEAGGILFMDDYAHHPTAVAATLKGYREFFPGKRIIVDFMSHTYSRTKELLREFGEAFSSADEVILHKIYASAREQGEHHITGKDLYHEVAKHHSHVHYFEEIMDALPYLKEVLTPGDLFVTMGAGDNWKIGRSLYDYYTNNSLNC